MASDYVRTVGELADIDEMPIVIGVDHEAVTVGWRGRPLWRVLTLAQAEEFAQAFTRATWEAVRNSERMRQEAGG